MPTIHAGSPRTPVRLLDIRLEDPDKFRKAAVFLGHPDRDYLDVHVNRSIRTA